MVCMPWTRAFTAAIVGICIAVAGILFHCLFFPKILRGKISEKLQILPNSTTFKAWSEPTVPIYIQFWLYNVTNTADVMKGRYPILQDIGPFTYRQFRKKVNISWNEDETLIEYVQTKHYQFQPNMSRGSLNDTIYTINIPFISVANKAQYMQPKERQGLDFMILVYKPTVFIKRTVDQMLFKGYYDKFIDVLQKAKKQETLKNATFGFLYNKNGTNDGQYEVHTGKGDVEKFAKVQRWKNNSTVSFWKTQYANMINGSDGSMFTPFMDRDATVHMFSSDLCRSIYMTYHEDTSVQGIPTYRFSPPFSLLANWTLNPDNKGFCTNDMDSDCLDSGLLNVSNCRNGGPIIVSLSHFFGGAEQYYQKAGFEPHPVDDVTFLDIEPNTGLVLKVNRRMQVNVPLKKYPLVKGFDDVPNMIFPVMWLNESMEFPEARADMFKKQVLNSINLGNTLAYALIGSGLLVLLLAVIYGAYILMQQKRTDAYPVENGKLAKQAASEMDRIQGTTKALLDKQNNSVTCTITPAHNTKV